MKSGIAAGRRGLACLSVATALLLCASNVQGKVTSTDDVMNRDSSLRQLIRGRSSALGGEHIDEDTHAGDDRELGRIKRRNGGGDSKGSKGSKGDKGGTSAGARRGPGCGIQCGDKDFAYIHLTGSYFFRDFNDDSTDVVPIEGSGRLNTTKAGSTLRIFEDDLRGTAAYFDHDDNGHPYKSDITGTVTGSCTILNTFAGESTAQVASEACLAHCTICVTYKGFCCEDGWKDALPWEQDKNQCADFRGVATVTGDLFFDVEVDASGSLVPLTSGGLVSLDGMGAITATAGELGPASNGGLGIIEYDAFDRKDGETYSIGLKVPFNDRASCKLQDNIDLLNLPSPPTSSPRPPPAQPSFSPMEPPPDFVCTEDECDCSDGETCLTDVVNQMCVCGSTLCSVSGQGNCMFTNKDSVASNSAIAARPVDNFIADQDGLVSSVCFYGHYRVDVVEDDFTITYYIDDAGDDGKSRPGEILATFSGGDVDMAGPEDTGLQIDSIFAAEPKMIFSYNVQHPAVEVTGGEQYWISISNADGTSWFRMEALSGDGISYYILDSDGMRIENSFDLAFCLQVETRR